MMVTRILIIVVLLTHQLCGQNLRLEVNESKIAASFRGLSVVDDKVAWISGSNGWVGISTNGGKDWTFNQIPGFEKVDFRSLYAFSSNKAVVANAGSPASILLTMDGGKTWKETYRNEAKAVFIDGVDFWNDREGIVYGDPLNSRLMMIHTINGGESWNEIKEEFRPLMKEGEASFAASGTGIRCSLDEDLTIVTGGMSSRLFRTHDLGKHWAIVNSPIIQGKSSTGIFSFAFENENQGIIVGGDYLIDSLKVNHVFYTNDGGNQWYAPKLPTRGYRECVEFVDRKTAIATGPSGSDVSNDGGVTWYSLSDVKGFHVVRKARHGSLILVAGSQGKIGLIK